MAKPASLTKEFCDLLQRAAMVISPSSYPSLSADIRKALTRVSAEHEASNAPA